MKKFQKLKQSLGSAVALGAPGDVKEGEHEGVEENGEGEDLKTFSDDEENVQGLCPNQVHAHTGLERIHSMLCQ